MQHQPIDFTSISPRNEMYGRVLVDVANGATLLALKLTKREMLAAAGVLYLHRHKKTGRCYVGVTEQMASARWFAGDAYRSNPRFGPALRKHGWSSFDSFILAFADSRDDLDRAEVQAISAAGGHKSRYTYNLSPGGGLVAENDIPIEAVNLRTGTRINFKSSSEASRTLGIKRPDSVAAVVRKKRHSYGDWWFRRLDDLDSTPPKVWGEALRRRRIKEVFGTPTVAVSLDTNERLEFETATDAADALGLFQTSVSMVLRKEQASAGGWVFFKLGDPEKLPTLYGSSLTRSKRDKAVFGYELATGQRRTFRNFTEADATLGLSPGASSAVASGSRASSGGWHFSTSPITSPPALTGGALVAAARSKPVIAINCDTGEQRHYENAKAASAMLGISRAAISHVVNGKRESTKGWRFKLTLR